MREPEVQKMPTHLWVLKGSSCSTLFISLQTQHFCSKLLPQSDTKIKWEFSRIISESEVCVFSVL